MFVAFGGGGGVVGKKKAHLRALQAASLLFYCCCHAAVLRPVSLSPVPKSPQIIGNSPIPINIWIRNAAKVTMAPRHVLIPKADLASIAGNSRNVKDNKKVGKFPVRKKDMEVIKKDYTKLWPDGDPYVRKQSYVWQDKLIPYEIAPQFPVKERKVILSAIKEVEANSCIKFVRRLNQTDYVKFIKTEPGCFSHVGHQGGEQWVNLSNDSACVRHALVVHELMHVLGWFHEHSRPDRDKFIKIFWHNVLEEYKDNFRVFDDDQIFDVGLLPYDYHSVTHYHSGAFSRFGLLPTVTNWNNRQMTLGNSRGLSPGDVQKLRRGYACGNSESKPKFVVLISASTSLVIEQTAKKIPVLLLTASYHLLPSF